MKKTILVFAVIGFTAFALNAQTTPQAASAATSAPVNANAPEAVYENEVLDYGTIEYDSDGNREFKFKNTGKEPLIVYSAVGSCGCTVPTPPKEPIKPGETGSIKVHYDTKRVGSFEKTVTVSSNGRTASKTLKIKGTVKAAAATAGSTTPAPTSSSPH